MAGSDRKIFRESAIERYGKSQERRVLLQLATPSLIAYLWIMLLLFIGAGIFAWFVQVPVTITGQGVIIVQEANKTSAGQSIGAAQSLYGTNQAAMIQPGTQNVTQPNTGPYFSAQATKTPLLPTRTVPHQKPQQPTPAPNTPTASTAAAAQPSPTLTPSKTPVAQGTVLQPGQQIMAVLFLPAEQRASLHTGEPATVNLDVQGLHLPGTIARIESGLINPADARTRFQLNGPAAQVISVPSILVMVQITTGYASPAYIGSMCHTDVHIGTQSILSLVPGIQLPNQFIKQ